MIMSNLIKVPSFEYPITLKPAGNGVIVEPHRDANCAYDDRTSLLFVDIDELNEFITDLITGDVTI
jgi:hypothetical protein